MIPTITTLPDSIVKQIAAGQVIHRPASVVKELIDNALDAGATYLKIELTQAGIDQITITDNGQGIPAAELPKAVLRHSTSKLTSTDDLATISTFGFRGEALASIATCADLSIVTRFQDEEIGTKLIIKAGQPLESATVSPLGAPVGTQVKVSNLFSSVPARLKHLAKRSTELQHCVQVVSHYAAIWPQVEWLLTHNQQVVLQFPATDSGSERVAAVLGLPADAQVNVESSSELVSVTGWLGVPTETSSHSKNVLLAVNGRPVKDRRLLKTVKASFTDLIDHRHYPKGVLHLNVPATAIDPNVDPQKWQVQVTDPAQIQAHLLQSIQTALGRSVYPQLTETKPWTFHDSAAPELLTKLKQSQKTWDTAQTRISSEVFQLNDAYLLHQNPAGNLVITDQHAAHERILYEQFLATFEQQKHSPNTRQLDPATDISLSAAEVAALESQTETLAQIGFTYLQTGPHTLSVRSIPEYIDPSLVSEVVAGLALDVLEAQPISAVDSTAKRTIAYAACRSAIKSGDSLSQAERKNLLHQLADTQTPFTCPHGRPIQIVVTNQELAKKFKRT